MVWVDATGVVIGPEPVFIDDAGVQWPLNLETAAPDVGPASAPYFESPDCTGDELVAISFHTPRRAFSVGSDGGAFVRPSDTLRATPRNVVTTRQLGGGLCYSAGGSAGVVLPTLKVSELIAIRTPASPFVGPLRREWR